MASKVPPGTLGKDYWTSLAEDEVWEWILNKKPFLPHYPQPALEKAAAIYTCAPIDGLRVVVDRKLVTGQNQWSASEYALQLYHLLTGSTRVLTSSFGKNS